MFKPDVKEAAPIVARAMTALLGTVPASGRGGSDLRSAVGDLLVNVNVLLQSDMIAPPLDNCFDLARQGGTTFPGIETVRTQVQSETPVSVGAVMIRDALLNFCFAFEGRIIADMTFISRDDVDAVKLQINAEFAVAEEAAADAMDAATFQALISMHAAISRFLIETARPLPRMLAIQFAAPLPTLIAAQRLYYDASRADELRDENKVVHPAFMLPEGRALSA